MSILKLAMYGLLVPPVMEGTSAKEFLQNIRNEKLLLISQGVIKPSINESFIFRGEDGQFYEQIGNKAKCIQDEIPYEIPVHWEWQRLSSVSYNHDSKRRPVSVKDREKLDKIYDYYGATGAIDKVDSYLFDGTFVLTGEDGGNFFTERDNAFIVRGKFWPNNHVHVLQVSRGFEEFFCYFLNSLNLGAMGLINGIAVPKLNQANLNSILVPIPPLAEQKRIVAKIEELMPFVEQYAEASTKLNTLNTTFPDMMKKSILQEAVQGKLVPQDPNDEPASELLKRIAEEKKKLVNEGKIKKQKALPAITENEIPFDIPESWEWVRFCEIMARISTGPFGSMLHKTDYVSNGIPIVNPIHMQNGCIIPSENALISKNTAERLNSYKLHTGDLVFARRGEIGRSAVVHESENGFVCGTGSFFATPFTGINPDFISLMFTTPYVRQALLGEAVGSTMNNLNQQILNSFLFPLPPTKEQERIVFEYNNIISIAADLNTIVNVNSIKTKEP